MSTWLLWIALGVQAVALVMSWRSFRKAEQALRSAREAMEQVQRILDPLGH